MTIGTLCGLLLLCIATLMCFLERSALSIICGVVLLVVAICAMERALHTEYRITPEGHLVIYKGRFSRERDYDLGMLESVEKIHTSFGLSHFLLLRFIDGKTIIIQPDNEESFIIQLNKFRK